MRTKIISLFILFLLLTVTCRSGQPDEYSNSTGDDSSSQPSNTSGKPPSGDADPSAPSSGEQPSTASEAPESIAVPGETLVTYIDSENIGKIAVQVSLPQTARYPEGAGVVVEVNTFLTPENRFYVSADVTQVGLIHVAYLWPGVSDRNVASEGVFDYGAELSIQALRDVIRFASGEITNSEGFYLDQLVAIQPLYDNVGLYAFSHPGQAAVNVLSLHGNQIPNVSYFVGRENPTIDKLTAVEVGYFSDKNRPELNPLYSYPRDYSPTDISIDYSSILWDAEYTEEGSNWIGVPYFDLNGNGRLDGGDHPLGRRVPAVNGKRLYSIDLTKALQDNNAFAETGWPNDVADIDLVKLVWEFQNSTLRYPDIGQKLPNLHVMIVFARFDHVQPALDKPHIHHAYDGFRHSANLWVRLNPDQAYVSWVNADLGAEYSDHAANQEPGDWLEIEGWGYSNRPAASQLVPLAAVAEMADRTQANNWETGLIATLYDYVFEDKR
jgi:hypothetical protein